MAHLPATLLHRADAAGGVQPVQPLAAGITDSARIAVVETSSTALSIFGSNGRLEQEVDGVRLPTSSLDADVVCGRSCEVFVRSDNRAVRRFGLRKMRYQRISSFDAALDITAMCYLNGWLVLAGWDSAGTHAMHVVDRRSGKLVRAIQTSESGAYPATRAESKRDRLACDPGTDMIYLVSSGTNVALRAFSLLGHRIWQRRIDDVPSNADPHPSSLVAVYGRGVLLQFRVASDTTFSTPVFRSHLTAFFDAKVGAPVVDRNLWARVVAIRGNRILWASEGAGHATPRTMLAWITP